MPLMPWPSSRRRDVAADPRAVAVPVGRLGTTELLGQLRVGRAEEALADRRVLGGGEVDDGVDLGRQLGVREVEARVGDGHRDVLVAGRGLPPLRQALTPEVPQQALDVPRRVRRDGGLGSLQPDVMRTPKSRRVEMGPARPFGRRDLDDAVGRDPSVRESATILAFPVVVVVTTSVLISGRAITTLAPRDAISAFSAWKSAALRATTR
jgi:hypothetical protein